MTQTFFCENMNRLQPLQYHLCHYRDKTVMPLGTDCMLRELSMPDEFLASAMNTMKLEDTYVNKLPTPFNNKALPVREISWSDPIGVCIARLWHPSTSYRTLGDGTGGICVAVPAKDLFPGTTCHEGEHVLKICMNSHARRETRNEAQVYEYLKPLQGSCIPTLLDYVKLRIEDDDWQRTVPSRSTFEINWGELRKAHCREQHLNPRGNEYCKDIDCELREGIRSSPISVLALVLKEVGHNLLPAPIRRNFNEEFRAAAEVVLQEVSRTFAELISWTNENPLHGGRLHIRNVIQYDGNILLIDLGKWIFYSCHEFRLDQHGPEDYDPRIEACDQVAADLAMDMSYLPKEWSPEASRWAREVHDRVRKKMFPSRAVH